VRSWYLPLSPWRLLVLLERSSLIIFERMCGAWRVGGKLPSSTYYLTLDRLWEGNTQYAAISAVFVANIVLVGYVFIAIFEDSTPPKTPEIKTRAKEESRKEK